MVHLRRPAGGRHLRATRWPVLVAAGVAMLLAVSPVAFAHWTARGSGTAVARTGTLKLAGVRPAVRAAGREVSVSWEQSQLMGRLLGKYRSGGYRVRRYDTDGRPQQLSTACSGRIAGPGATLDCVEHSVPEGIWQYAVTPVLGGWTGTEGPRSDVAVSGAAVTIISPADGSATNNQRPTLSGTAADNSPPIIVAISRGRSPGAAPQILTATVAGSSWSARPVRDFSEGVYTVRARQADWVGRPTWSRPSIFRIDTTAPATADNTAAISEGWKRTDQTVNLRPVDPGGSGVAATYSTTDGSAPTTDSIQASSVSVGEGIYVIKYFSVDQAGNSEAVRSAPRRIRVDRTVPSTATLGPLPDVVRNGQMLTGGGDDALSGVARVVYEFCADVGCASWTTIGSSTAGPAYPLVWRGQLADGSYQVRARVLDAAGNTATSAPQTVQVDNTSSTDVDVTSADDNGTVEAGTR
jgi:hypothetical protein